VKSRLPQNLLFVGAALLLGWLALPLVRSINQDLGRGGGAASSLENVGESSLGQGMSFAILGGYRQIVANLVWITMNEPWREKDFDDTYSHIRLATSINPEHLMFWLDGSRIVANDMPVWEVGLDHIEALTTTVWGRAIQERYAREALRLLLDGRAALPQSPYLLLEMGVIHWRKLGDLEGAAPYFERAAALPDAPYYAARVYAELLVRLGREREALQYLRELLPALPSDEPEAMRAVVLDRIRRLEARLGEEASSG